MRIYGDIEDARTEKPLSGALVSLYIGDTCLVENTPATGGNFSFSFDESLAPLDSEILTCKVKKKGYHSQTATKEIVDENLRFSLELVPILLNWRKWVRIALIVLVCLLILALVAWGIYEFFFNRPPLSVSSFSASYTFEGIEFEMDSNTRELVVAANSEVMLSGEVINANLVYLNSEEIKTTPKKAAPPQTDGNKILVWQKKVDVKESAEYTVSVEEDQDDWTASTMKKLNVTVPSLPQIVSLDAQPLVVDKYGNSILKWSTAHAQMVYVTESSDTLGSIISRAKEAMREFRKDQAQGSEQYDIGFFLPSNALRTCVGPEGSCSVNLLEPATYTLVAVNLVGEVDTRRVKVDIHFPPVINYFTTTAENVKAGDKVLLEWETVNADSVLLNGAKTGLTYAKQVAPVETTRYVLEAANKVGSVFEEITVKVPDSGSAAETGETPGKDGSPTETMPSKVNYFHTIPTVIAIGQSCTLKWVVEHAETVYLNGELVNPVGSRKVFPQVTTSFELKVVDHDGDEYCWPRTVEVKPNTCTIILYELENYRGDYEEFSEDSPDIGGLNNDVSSIRIIGDCSVKVYSGNNYKAIHQVFSKSIPRLRGTLIGNDNVSAIKIIRAKWNKQ